MNTLFSRSWYQVFSVFVVICAVLLASCTGLAKPAQEDLGPFVRRLFDTTINAGETVETDSEAVLSFSLLEARENGVLQDMVRTLLYDGFDAESYARHIMADWESAYKEVVSRQYFFEGEYSAGWSYEELHTISLVDRYAVLSRFVSVYQGGAHPNYYENLYVINMHDPRRLGLADIIEEANMPDFYALTDRALRLYSEKETKKTLPPGKPLSGGIFLVDAVTLPEDFYPAGDGLHLQWDPYEIASYAAGGIDVVIGWKDLSPILTPEGRGLENAFKK